MSDFNVLAQPSVQLAERRAKAERKAAFEAAQKAKAKRLAAAEAARRANELSKGKPGDLESRAETKNQIPLRRPAGPQHQAPQNHCLTHAFW